MFVICSRGLFEWRALAAWLACAWRTVVVFQYLDVGRSDLWCCHKFVSPEVALHSVAEEVRDGMYVYSMYYYYYYHHYTHV